MERQTDDEGRFRPGELPKYRPPYDELRTECAPVRALAWLGLGLGLGLGFRLGLGLGLGFG